MSKMKTELKTLLQDLTEVVDKIDGNYKVKTEDMFYVKTALLDREEEVTNLDVMLVYEGLSQTIRLLERDSLFGYLSVDQIVEHYVLNKITDLLFKYIKTIDKQI